VWVVGLKSMTGLDLMKTLLREVTFDRQAEALLNSSFMTA
jgi:hypothetical protein